MANDWCQLSVSDSLLEKVGKTLHTDGTANSLRAAVELFNGEIAAFASDFGKAFNQVPSVESLLHLTVIVQFGLHPHKRSVGDPLT